MEEKSDAVLWRLIAAMSEEEKCIIYNVKSLLLLITLWQETYLL